MSITPQHPYGEVVPCGGCAELGAFSGLSAAERKLTLADIITTSSDTRGCALALRVAGGLITSQRRGFVSLYGNTGSAKSTWAKAVAAQFLRQGVQAKYAHAKEIEQSLFTKDAQGDLVTLQNSRDRWLRTPVLAVDEAQTFNWKSAWVSGEINKLFDARFRMADAANPSERQVTVFVSQYEPKLWAPDFLLSRMSDTRFAIPWPQGVDEPPCVQNGWLTWPFRITMPDMRSRLPSSMQSMRVNPQTGEVIE